jgi:hypothetical protein
MKCSYCKKDIADNETPYESKQIGLEGVYHWQCFTKIVKEVNRQGQHMMEGSLMAAGIYRNSDEGGTESL